MQNKSPDILFCLSDFQIIFKILLNSSLFKIILF